MTCPQCGHQNPQGVKFCGECGAALSAERACLSCGTANPPETKFCHECGAALATAAAGAAPSAPVERLPASFAGGRYAVRRFIGEGAKKRVYLAHDTRLDRDIAFALIKTEGLDADGIVRVRREAQAMGRLGDHPHIVTIFDTGNEAGAPYIVSQYRAGGSVEDILAGAPQHRIAADRAMRIAANVCLALEHAHARGIVHRDLKPGNVWLDDAGDAALGDFGLAVVLDRSRMTMAGMMVGTVAYMAPEQALGRSPDARSDLYALGAMLYEMVAGRPPFLGDDAVGVISQHINTPPVAPSWHNPECPKPLEALILRLLAKAPDERPASAAEVAQELRRILDRSTVEPPPQQRADAAGDLRALNWGWFVGRKEEMDQLRAALEDALSGKASLAMLVGEPGIGKTRLAEEFGVYAGLRGAQVLTGHCYEGEASLPYRPFIEAFRQYTRSRPDAELRRELGAGAPEIATLVSEIRQRFADIEEAPRLDPEAERLRLFESVSDFLRNATAAQPVVLHLDDLHWSDKPSLLLLQHLAQRTSRDRLLVLGAYRDVELERTHPLAETLGALRRLPNYRRILLRGLPVDTVADLLTVIDPSEEGAPVRQALAAALHHETEGNPFFIREVLAHLVETGKIVHENGRWVGRVTSIAELGIPEGVREVIGRRLSQLSDACNRMLTLASTMTGGFSWDALKAINAGVPEGELLDLLEEALAKQLIAERKGEHAGMYDFTHALIRQTLYGELSTPRRVLLHRQIGDALEQLYAGNVDAHLPELAHHFYQAAPGGDVQKAIDYARRAGDRAMATAAWEEAAGHYERALLMLELQAPVDAGRQCELLLAVGEAQFSSGEVEASRATFKRACDVARTARDADTFGRAALGYVRQLSVGFIDQDNAAVLREALGLLPATDSALKAMLVSRLGQEMYFGEQDEFKHLTKEGVEIARRVGDKRALAECLWSRLWGGTTFIDSAEERLAEANEIIALAQDTGDRQRRAMGLFHRIVNRMVVGEVELAYADIDQCGRVSDELRMPFYHWQMELFRGMRAMFEGRLDDAEASAQQALAIGQRGQADAAAQMFAAQIFAIRREQGRLAELADGIRGFVEMYPAIPAWRTALAYNYAERGMLEEARREFEILAADDFAMFPRDANWPIALALLVEVCAYLHDRERAAYLYQELLPAADKCVIVGSCVDVYGVTHGALGRLAFVLDRWDDAERHYASALEKNMRMGAHRWTARIYLRWGELLLQRDGIGDREKALDFLGKAIDLSEPRGMKANVEQALALKLRAQGATASGLYTSIDHVARAVERERPALPQQALAPDGTVTIMFSDIEDSTVLTERLGDDAWMALLRQHNALIREQIAAYDGYEVKTIGDAFMVAFRSARKALDCAVAIQRAFAAHNASAPERIAVRVGLHAGEAVREDDDFYGKNVIMASRVAGKAAGGEVLASSLVHQLVNSSVPAGTFATPVMVELKGLSGTHALYPVLWDAPVPGR